jgi:hypothetical protein
MGRLFAPTNSAPGSCCRPFLPRRSSKCMDGVSRCTAPLPISFSSTRLGRTATNRPAGGHRWWRCRRAAARCSRASCRQPSETVFAAVEADNRPVPRPPCPVRLPGCWRSPPRMSAARASRRFRQIAMP